MNQDKLKELLEYNPETGVFRWLIKPCKNKAAGGVAGTITGNGYCQIRIDRGFYFAHRLAFLYMIGSMPTDMVDHINGDKLDNRWSNLRPCTNQQNQLNRRKNLKCPGVRLVAGKYWRAFEAVTGKSIGQRLDYFEACCLRKSWEHKTGFNPKLDKNNPPNIA